MNAVLERIGRVYARAQSSRAEGKQETGVARVISLANQKGGVAKTTSTVNLGVALSEMGRHVLIVDLDPQANLTMSQGFDPEKLDESMFDVLCQRMPIEQIIKHAEVDIAVASIELAGAELALASMIGRERAADDYGVDLIGDGEPFARALENLCVTNLSELRPPRHEQWLGASHPPPYQRIARARSRGKENPTSGANGAL